MSPPDPPPIPHSRPWLAAEDHRAVAEQLATEQLATGARVAELERSLAAYLRCDGAVAVSSGTAALALGLAAMGIGEGDEIILPSYVCENVRDSIVRIGATPVLCDVGEHWVMTASTVAPRVTARTVAIVAVHVFGIRAPIEELAALGPAIVEDGAQAFGIVPAAASAFSFYSFHATKCLTTGVGGALAANRRDLLDRARPASAFAPLADLQAALGIAQLGRYPRFLERRAALAARYLDELADLPLVLPMAIRDASMFFRFPIRVPGGDFETIRARFAEHGVHVRRGVDALLHREGAHAASEFPNTERLFAETVSIPIYPALRDDEQDRVIAACRRVFAG